MTAQELRRKYTTREMDYQKLNALVSGAAICAEFLSDVEQLLNNQGDELLTLRRAAVLSGYSADHLGRLVKQGVVPNAGRKGSPRIRLVDLPKRPNALREDRASNHVSGVTPGQIARAVVSSEGGKR